MVMAQIYTNCGRYDEAIDELEYVLSLETEYNVNRLKFISWIEPLKDLPRFQAVMKQYAQ